MDNNANVSSTQHVWVRFVQRTQSPLVELSPYLITALVVFLLGYSLLFSSHGVEKLPSVNPVGFFASSTAVRRSFLVSGGVLFQKARGLFPDQPYRMMTDLGDVVVLPHRMVDEIRSIAKLSFPAANQEAFHGGIAGFDAMSQFAHDDRLLEAVVRKQLAKNLFQVTEPLSREAEHALSVNFGDTGEWKEYFLKPALLDIVGRMSSRIFLGPELCRNEKWLKITKEYTVSLFTGAAKLRVYPKPLRTFVHWFLPECKTLRKQFSEAQKVIQPLINTRRTLRHAAREMGKEIPYFNDALDWGDEEATVRGIKYDAAAFQLMLSVSAVHTTTDLLIQVMLDLAQHPEFVQTARDEITRELKYDGWQKASLSNMKILDSIIKESQRLKPIGLVAMRRVATEDVKLSTGLLIPKGTRTLVDAYRMRDPEVHNDPEEWQGDRFVRMSQQPGRESMASLVTTHADHLAFGHGVWACPGRFFAGNELKITLCHLLMKYEWNLAPGTSVQPMVLGAAIMANPTAKIRIRRRARVEFDIDCL